MLFTGLKPVDFNRQLNEHCQQEPAVFQTRYTRGFVVGCEVCGFEIFQGYFGSDFYTADCTASKWNKWSVNTIEQLREMKYQAEKKANDEQVANGYTPDFALGDWLETINWLEFDLQMQEYAKEDAELEKAKNSDIIKE